MKFYLPETFWFVQRWRIRPFWHHRWLRRPEPWTWPSRPSETWNRPIRRAHLVPRCAWLSVAAARKTTRTELLTSPTPVVSTTLPLFWALSLLDLLRTFRQFWFEDGDRAGCKCYELFRQIRVELLQDQFLKFSIYCIITQSNLGAHSHLYFINGSFLSVNESRAVWWP